MPLASSTLRPGRLVSLKTSIKGNVKYVKNTLEADRVVDIETDGDQKGRKAKWETERTIEDAAEHQAATEARTKVRTLISSACAKSEFGLLCPEDKVEQLDAAIAEAREVAAAFNAKSKLTTVRVFCFTGRVAPDDVEAVRAINAEVTGLLDTMAQGLKDLDVGVVREAANRARSVGQMLSDKAQGRVKDAIEAARSAARKIVAAGEQGAVEIDAQTLRAIAEARTAFLDLDGTDEVDAPVDNGRALDLAPTEEIKVSVPTAAAIELEQDGPVQQ